MVHLLTLWPGLDLHTEDGVGRHVANSRTCALKLHHILEHADWFSMPAKRVVQEEKFKDRDFETVLQCLLGCN